MEERRATIRRYQRLRAEYCPSERPVPHDGVLTNVSEHGAGLLAWEAHPSGDRLTVNLLPPGLDDLLTATGIVRWSNATPMRSGQYALGLEWLPLEPTARERFQRLLRTSTERPLSPRKPLWHRRWLWEGAALLTVALVAVLGVMQVSQWIGTLKEENRRLAGELFQREWLTQRLTEHQDELSQDLVEAKTNLVTTTDEVARLDRQAHTLREELGHLQQNIERFEQSSAGIREEREELLQRVMDLEQERTALTRRLSSVEELRRAIREAIEARRARHRAERLALTQAKAEALAQRRAQSAESGNQGYVIHDGRATVSPATVWIKVHDPEPVASP